ncbi:MAG: Asp-tRNA(Asn)/Glu-tRNA(Gln) amidotransferase subunit GatC [Vicinamibacteria bacterium]
MTKVTTDTVDHVARLAHVSLTPEERATFARQLDDILAYAESIQSLDTASVPPMSHAGTDEAFREDAARPSLDSGKALAAAPDPADRLFRVPRVLGG